MYRFIQPLPQNVYGRVPSHKNIPCFYHFAIRIHLLSPNSWLTWISSPFLQFWLLENVVYLFTFFGYIQGIEKFLGQKSNLCHSSNPSHNSDNVGSFTLQGTPWECHLNGVIYYITLRLPSFTQYNAFKSSPSFCMN